MNPPCVVYVVFLQKASGSGSMFPTIMLTGLPDGFYKYEDVARVFLSYFPEQDLDSLYYNVLILPLQKRVRGRPKV